ncbi:MAG TPA: hypothetical protein VM164_12155 [Burkholderiales bacterium]|nr:hypothetical protein [Burkholderiales bacterium]
MAATAIPLIAVSALVLAACDFSQTKPETTLMRPGTSALREAPAHPLAMRVAPGGMQEPTDMQGGTPGESRPGAERSIRLDGPGVSSKLQIRI